MARIYATLIRKGEKTIEDVPERLRAAVEALLAEDAVCAPSASFVLNIC